MFFRNLVENIIAAGNAGEGVGKDLEGFRAVFGHVLAAYPGVAAAVVLISPAHRLGCEVTDFFAGGGEFFAQRGEWSAGGALAWGFAEQFAHGREDFFVATLVDGDMGERHQRALLEPLLGVFEIGEEEIDVGCDHVRGAALDEREAGVLDEPGFLIVLEALDGKIEEAFAPIG